MSTTYEVCAEACTTCATECDRCLSACLLERDVAPLVQCIALDLECAALCRLLAGFADRGSKFAPQLATACKAVCAVCADECERHEHAHCQRCVAACRACFDACDALIALGVEPPVADSAAANRAR